MSGDFPELGDWQETRRSLHAWSKVLSAVRAASTTPHPHWWHISLAAVPRGLVTGPLVSTTDGERLSLELDLTGHRLAIVAGGEPLATLALTDRPTARALGDWVLERLNEAGERPLAVAREKWDDDGARRYDPAAAERYRRALTGSARLLDEVRDSLPGERGPVQLWAHHFDLSFELFGSRRVPSDEGEQPAQIGFGFFPGDDEDPGAYFYGTPWPFADELMAAPLPEPAAWQQEPWQGARLEYTALVDGGVALLRDFLLAVWTAGRVVLD